MVNTPGRCTARLPPVKPTDCVLNRATCTQSLRSYNSVQLAMNTAQPRRNFETDAKGAIGTWYEQLKVDPKRATGTHNEHIETPRRFVIAGTRGVGL
ncbi:hypothetical protein D9615_008449 [Tricholomella constricta]|uniref:Uncharacterized protein n=1 Tax=Tricholomella constricta TaxID=117010 RepID=A0A8H5H429_9AGAR|nr:hypothetical protein D9615_008449 [Tricholomella constricta]